MQLMSSIRRRWASHLLLTKRAAASGLEPHGTPSSLNSEEDRCTPTSAKRPLVAADAKGLKMTSVFFMFSSRPHSRAASLNPVSSARARTAVVAKLVSSRKAPSNSTLLCKSSSPHVADARAYAPSRTSTAASEKNSGPSGSPCCAPHSLPIGWWPNISTVWAAYAACAYGSRPGACLAMRSRKRCRSTVLKAFL